MNEVILKSVRIFTYIGPILRQGLMCLEVWMYFKLYKTFKESSNSVKNNLTSKQLSQRYKKSTINLTGQIMLFVVNTLLNLAIIFFKIRETKQDKPFFLLSLGLISGCLGNVALFIGSPDLRRKYLGDDDTWWPKMEFLIPICSGKKDE